MISIKFESAALSADTFQILKMDGEEEISHLFRFELQLVSRDPNIDFKAVLQAKAHIAIETQGNTRYLHGMLSEFEQFGEWQNGVYEYRAVVVPRLWMMSQSTQNQIFQEQTVPQIIESELNSIRQKGGHIDSELSLIRQKGGHPLVMNGLSVDDYELFIIKNYIDKEREYVVQYKETDLNFISRLMEHEGIYYYFEHDENREKLVITDTMATEEIAGDSYAEFLTEAATARYDRNVVYRLSRSQKQIPGSVMVTDFNYRTPTVPMQSDNYTVLEEGVGIVTEFGAHFKDSEEGLALAKIRAEEFRCRENIYAGESNIPAFTCGGLYSLGQHFRAEYNQTYMITKVEHHASQEIESWGNVGNTNYHNAFNCIPSGMSYRPQRLTPKPKLYGIMNGTIDSEQNLGRADLDEFGRYKVKMPFDMNGAAPGMASRRIRMAQPYGGAGDDGAGIGMSFPLLKGTEVIWTCIDGDIDRPIITGVVPNPLQPSVTNTQNANSNVVKTSSGVTMSFHDGSGRGASQNTTGGGAVGGLAPQQQFQNTNSEFRTSEIKQNEVIDTSDFTAVSTLQTASTMTAVERQQQLIADNMDLEGVTSSFTTSTGLFTGTGKQWSIGVPDYEDAVGVNTGDSKDCYLRLGKASDGEGALGGAWANSDGEGIDGWMSYVDGTRTEITKGNVNRHHYGVVSDFYNVSQFGYAGDDQYEVSSGLEYSATLGLVGEYQIGGKSSATSGFDVNFNSGWSYEFGWSSRYTMIQGTDFSISDRIDQEASERVFIKVDPESEGTVGLFMEEHSGKVGAALAAIGAIPLTMVAVTEGNQSWPNDNILRTAAYTQAALSLAMMAAAKRHQSKKGNDKPASYIDMNPNRAEIMVRGVQKVPQTLGKRWPKAGALSPFGVKDKSSMKDIKPENPKSFVMDVLGTHDDKNPVSIHMNKKVGQGNIEITAGKQEGGKEEPDSNIVLKVGQSSITIKDEGITFDAPCFLFQIDKKVKYGMDEKLLYVAGDLQVDEGAFAKKLFVDGKIVGKSVEADRANLGAAPAQDSPPDKPKKLKPAKTPAKGKTIQEKERGWKP